MSSLQQAPRLRPDVGAEPHPAPSPHVGDLVLAQDGRLGRVDRVVRSEAKAPVYLVVAVGLLARRRYPVVPCALVTAVDRSRRHVHLRGRRGSLGRLPETLPLVL